MHSPCCAPFLWSLIVAFIDHYLFLFISACSRGSQWRSTVESELMVTQSVLDVHHICIKITLVNVYVDLLVFTRIAGTS